MTKGLPAVDLATLHRRMGHITGKALEVTAKEFFRLVGPRQLESCDPCNKRKIKRSPVLATAHYDQDVKIGEEWNADLFYLKTRTFAGRRWALVCTDTRSKMTRIFLLFKKNEQFRAFFSMIPWSETQTGNKVRFFRSDGDWEAKEVKDELTRLGIEHRLTTTDTPTSNAIAERMGGVLGEKAGAMLFEARLPEVMGGGRC
jgi:transposase InsO family protein